VASHSASLSRQYARARTAVRPLFLLTAIVVVGCQTANNPDQMSVAASTGSSGECEGTPPDAVTTLRPPLSEWARLTCTPFGHVIEANDGWIWSNPGAYSPVFIPAQMVRQNPSPLGNASYFTRIDFVEVTGAEARSPYDSFHVVFPREAPPQRTYRLDAVSNSGKSLRIFFLEYPDAPWGIWCPDDKCDPSSLFMLLNMRKSPPRRT